MSLRHLLGGIAFLALATLPAKAVVLQATDVGASGTTTIQGFVDVNGQATSIPGLTGSLYLEYDGLTNGGLTWNFDYTVTNTSSGTVDARLSSFALGLSPNPVSATSTGLFGFAQVGNNLYPNVAGANNIVDVCFGSSFNTCGGGLGLLDGQSASGEFTLTFSTVLSSIDLQAALARFQSIDGSPFNFNGASGVGFNVGDVNITPFAVPGPLAGAGIPGLVMALGGLIAFNRRRRQRLA